MSDPKIWFDCVRKYVKSEGEGLGIMANAECMPIFAVTAEAVVNGAEKRGIKLSDAHSMEPRLVVNANREGVFAEYSHYIEVITTALMHEAVSA